MDKNRTIITTTLIKGKCPQVDDGKEYKRKMSFGLGEDTVIRLLSS